MSAARPTAAWSAEEREKRAQLEQGVAVAVNMRRHGNLIAWARERGLIVGVDRATPWGNPFVIGRDGDRGTVIARYRDDDLPRLARLARASRRAARQGARLLVRAGAVPRGRAHRGGGTACLTS